MSFILDALKKSETDRQRQNGPALFEVRVPPPRSGLPLWAVGLAALLAVNLLIVGWVLLRRPAAAEAATAAPPAPGQTAGGGSGGSYPGGSPGQGASAYPGAGQAPAGYAGAGQGPATQPYPGAAQGSGQPYPGAPSGPAQAYQGSGAAPGSSGAPAGPQGAQQGQGMAQQGPQGPAGTVTVAGTAPTSPIAQTAGMTQPPPAYPGNGAGGNNARGGQADASTGQLNPDDYAPATDAPAPAGFGNHVSRGTSSGVPLYQDAAVAPGAHIPELRLDLHVFAAKPQERFVMINMHKLHEGDNLPEGVHVESITPEGAVLSSNGTRFLLPRD
jgi:general secretion pathway protein B